MKNLIVIISSVAVALAVGVAATSFAAAEGKPATETGYLRDAFCFNVSGAHGSSHKKCATECAKKGIPVALEEKDGSQIVLLPQKNDESLPDDVINKMEEQVTVTGKEYKKGGITYLQVESVK